MSLLRAQRMQFVGVVENTFSKSKQLPKGVDAGGSWDRTVCSGNRCRWFRFGRFGPSPARTIARWRVPSRHHEPHDDRKQALRPNGVDARQGDAGLHVCVCVNAFL